MKFFSFLILCLFVSSASFANDNLPGFLSVTGSLNCVDLLDPQWIEKYGVPQDYMKKIYNYDGTISYEEKLRLTEETQLALPNNLTLKIVKLRLLVDSKQYSAALTYADKLTDLSRNIEFLSLRFQALLALDKRQEAFTAATELLNNPDFIRQSDHDVDYVLGLIFYLHFYYPEIRVPTLRLALEFFPDNEFWLKKLLRFSYDQKNFDLAFKTLERLFSIRPVSDPKWTYELPNKEMIFFTLLEYGRMDQAERILEHILPQKRFFLKTKLLVQQKRYVDVLNTTGHLHSNDIYWLRALSLYGLRGYPQAYEVLSQLLVSSVQSGPPGLPTYRVMALMQSCEENDASIVRHPVLNLVLSNLTNAEYAAFAVQKTNIQRMYSSNLAEIEVEEDETEASMRNRVYSDPYMQPIDRGARSVVRPRIRE